MITSLSGRVLHVRPQSVVVCPGPDGSPFEIEAFIPAYWASRLADEVGRVIRLHTRLVLESVNQGAAFTPRLLGFASEADRAFFEVFTSVKGVGPRKALKAMAIEPAAIAAAVSARDARTLQTLPEIGKRLAETIIAELHGKLDAIDLGPAGPSIEVKAPGGPVSDAVAALVALGQTRGDAEAAVARVMTTDPEGEALTADEIVGRAFAMR